MKKIILLLALAPVLALAHPDRLERDLGHGLAYCRVHVLPADLPPVAARPGPLVLDLRGVRADDAGAERLGNWIKSRSSSQAPVMALVNPDTAPAVLAYFTSHDAPEGLVFIGPKGPGFEPDIAVKVSAEADRAAYAALEHGTAIEDLLTDHAVKERHDEASIAQERNAPADDSADTDSDLADSAGDKPAPAAPPQVIDYTLLRAVHLHRTLLALKRL